MSAVYLPILTKSAAGADIRRGYIFTRCEREGAGSPMSTSTYNGLPGLNYGPTSTAVAKKAGVGGLQKVAAVQKVKVAFAAAIEKCPNFSTQLAGAMANWVASGQTLPGLCREVKRAFATTDQRAAMIVAKILSAGNSKAAGCGGGMAKKKKKVRKLAATEQEKDKKFSDRKTLGPLEHAYIADATGAQSLSRLGDKLKQLSQEPGHKDRNAYDQLMIAQGPLNDMVGERVQRGAARMAESPAWRILSAIDPTRKGRNEGLVGLASGFGGGADQATGAKRRAASAYAKFLQPHQDKLDASAKPSPRPTPYHLGLQATFADKDADVAGQVYMRNEHPWQYWLNPLGAAGPLSELGDRAMRRSLSGLGRPDSTFGRVGMQLGQLATLGLLPLAMGGEGAQQKLRASAVENDLYAPEAKPDVMSTAKAAALAPGRWQDKLAATEKVAFTAGLQNWWSGLMPNMRLALLGAGAGGTLGAAKALVTSPDDPYQSRLGHAGSSILGGAAIGGGLGALAGYGRPMLSEAGGQADNLVGQASRIGTHRSWLPWGN